jgi:branched-chain amino acid transport system substrate-binding protein
MRNSFLKLSAAIFLNFASVTFAYADESNLVKIGVIAPLSGGSAAIGEEIVRTIEVIKLQSKEHNYKSSFEFFIEDGKAAVDVSPTTAAKKLIESNKVIFLVTATSGETLQVAPLAEQSKIITFGVYSGHPQIRNQGIYIFRTFIDTEKGIAKIAEKIRRNGDLPFSLLTEEHAFNIGIKTLLEKQFKKNELFLTDYPYESLDLRPILLREKSKNPKALYLNCSTPKTCSIIVNQTRLLGIKIPLYSYLHMDTPEFLENTKLNLEGIFFLSPPNLNAPIPRYIEFLDEYEKKFGFKPKNEFLSRTTFDAIKCIFDTADATGNDSTSALKYLANYKDQGALGEVSFDENGDIRDIEYVIKVIKDGHPILVDD